MTTKTNTKPVTKSTDTDKFNVVTATKGLIEKGDRYNQAAIAAIAHILSHDVWEGKIRRGVATKLAADLNYDKGNISRIGAIVVSNHKARRAAMALDILHIDDTPETLMAAVKIGAMFKRQTVKSATKSTGTKSEESATTTDATATDKKGEETDVLALVDAWLRGATDKQYAARVALVNSLLATIESERATAQAESDATEQVAA